MTDTDMTDTLTGKVALVAGATRGAGRTIAVELARGNAPTVLQPSFQEMDELIGRLPADPLAAM